MNTYPLVCILILHWRGIERTRACLHSVQALDYDPYRVMLVDNGANQADVATLRREFPAVQVLSLGHNRGFAGGMNPAIRQALQQGGAACLLLNNDTLVPPDLLSRLVAMQRAHPDIGILTPRLLRDDESGRLAGLGCHVTRFDVQPVGWDALDNADYADTALLHFDAVFGSAMFVLREVFERAGLFDERFFFYYEDIDLCVRARASGYQAACYPAVTVRHAVAASTAHVPGLRLFYLGRSRQLFFRKHRRGLLRWCYLLQEPWQVARMARARWRAGSPADALGYVAGSLVGLMMGDQGERLDTESKNV